MITAPTNVIWQPHAGGQTDFLTCPVYEALLEGNRSGGKTDALLMSFAANVGRGYGTYWRGALFRLTYPQLADVTIRSRRWFSQIFPNSKFNEANHEWRWSTGESLVFRYGENEKDYWNYHGHEYPWLGFEELTNWRDGSFFEAMHTTCRSSNPNVPRMVRSTCNPFGRGHSWVKERYRLGGQGVPQKTIIGMEEGKQLVAIHADLFENKAFLSADPNYPKTLEAIKDVNRKKAWLLGDWDIHVGSFLEGVWNANVHVVEPFAVPSSWKVWKSLDWGYAAPYCALWFALDPDGCFYVWRELYGAGEELGKGTRESVSAVANKIIEVEKHDARNGYDYRMNLADPSIFSQTGTDRSVGVTFREQGVRWQEAWNAKGSRINGAQEIIRLLAEHRLKIFSTCTHLLRTVPALPPDDYNPEDVDTKAEDHAWDALRYGIMRRRRNPDQPVAETDLDDFGLSVQGDQHVIERDYLK